MADDKQCWECLKRRRVCDRSRPACNKCSVRGIGCPGYGQKPLKWMPPGQTGAKRRAPPDRRCERLAVAPAVDVCPEATRALEAIEYYNTHVCPDLLTTGAAGAENPFFTPLTLAHEMPPVILALLASSAVGHHILQSSSRPRPEMAVLTTRLSVHRGESLRLLAQALAQPALQTSDGTLVSVLVLLLAEIQQSVASFTWRLHLDAASAIIRARGGLSDVLVSLPVFRHLLRYFVLIDIMGSTTAPCVEADRARRQLELVPLLPDLFESGLFTCFPCAPELLQDIIAVNHLRSRLEGPEAMPQAARLHQALRLLQRIRRFSAMGWAAEVMMGTCCARDGVPDPTKATGSWDWQRVARLYQSAVALYCISSLLGREVFRGKSSSPEPSVEAGEPQPSKSYRETCVGVSDMRSEYCARLLHHLRAVAGGPDGQLRKMTMWPLTVAGIELDPADEASKRFVGDELAWISSTVGIASPLVGRRLLQEGVWRFRGGWHGHGSKTWASLFDGPYIFAV